MKPADNTRETTPLTLEQAKDLIAQKYEWGTWTNVCDNMLAVSYLNFMVNEIAELYCQSYKAAAWEEGYTSGYASGSNQGEMIGYSKAVIGFKIKLQQRIDKCNDNLETFPTEPISRAVKEEMQSILNQY